MTSAVGQTGEGLAMCVSAKQQVRTPFSGDRNLSVTLWRFSQFCAASRSAIGVAAPGQFRYGPLPSLSRHHSRHDLAHAPTASGRSLTEIEGGFHLPRSCTSVVTACMDLA